MRGQSGVDKQFAGSDRPTSSQHKFSTYTKKYDEPISASATGRTLDVKTPEMIFPFLTVPPLIPIIEWTPKSFRTLILRFSGIGGWMDRIS